MRTIQRDDGNHGDRLLTPVCFTLELSAKPFQACASAFFQTVNSINHRVMQER
jgi:hypothetical protein